ncbi:MAG: lysophospholipid acyltransferase family protein [Mucilaginibacter sp.]
MINKGLSRLGIGFLYLLSLLPFWMLYLISDLLFVIVYHLVGYRRKVVQENLRNSFPEKNEQERRDIEKKYYQYLCDLMVETIKMITISQKEVAKRVTSDNIEVLQSYFKQGKSVIGALGHYCNWEMANLGLSSYFNTTLLVVYKPLSNKIFDDFFIKMRSRFGSILVAMKNTARTLVKYKNEQTFSLLVADQTPVKHEAVYFTGFLHQQTAFFLGIEKLAKLTDQVVVFCDVKRLKRGYYEYNLIPITETPKQTAEYEITNAYIKCLEEMIRREPQYWLWSHRRWKFKPEDKA